MAIARARNIPLVDLRVRFRHERAEMDAGRRAWNDLYNPGDYTHLNHEGMRLAADELWLALSQQGWLAEH